MAEKLENNPYDRRKHMRVDLDNTCYIQHSKSVCTIKNISIGGLACRCVKEEVCGKEFLIEADIYCRSSGRVAHDIKMKIVDSTFYAGQLLKSLGFRECRFEFKNLGEVQHNQLEEILLTSSFY